MKISIRDGHKHGMFESGFEIELLEESPRAYWTCEVTQEQWDEWLAFLKNYFAWESFWEAKCSKENRSR